MKFPKRFPMVAQNGGGFPMDKVKDITDCAKPGDFRCLIMFFPHDIQVFSLEC